jgi:hypothetical protein
MAAAPEMQPGRFMNSPVRSFLQPVIWERKRLPGNTHGRMSATAIKIWKTGDL